MATYRFSVLGGGTPDASVSPDTVGGQITAAADPSVGRMGCYVLADGGVDEGLSLHFSIPKNYVGSPAIIVQGILDGAPGASDTLGFGFRKRAVADNESADGTFDAEQPASDTVGSGGLNYADKDLLTMSIALTAVDYAVDDRVLGYVFLDASATSYTGNFLLIDVLFQYADT
jgi:hypothetical protein